MRHSASYRINDFSLLQFIGALCIVFCFHCKDSIISTSKQRISEKKNGDRLHALRIPSSWKTWIIRYQTLKSTTWKILLSVLFNRFVFYGLSLCNQSVFIRRHWMEGNKKEKWQKRRHQSLQKIYKKKKWKKWLCATQSVRKNSIFLSPITQYLTFGAILKIERKRESELNGRAHT